MAKSIPPPGTSDIFPDEIGDWIALENSARNIFPLYGYGEIRTPVFEYTEVFKRGLGDETEVVKKEMYTFDDRGGRSITLRPEGTAGVMRALSGTDAMNGVEHRVFYMGPMFRGERPSAGRRRQFHQIGVENAGSLSPAIDAECIAMLCHYLEDIGCGGFKLMLNTRGVKEDRPAAEQALKEYFAPNIKDMCEDCASRLVNNVWRILDCKCEKCQKYIESAPDAVSLFGQGSKDYFAKVCDTLTAMNVPFTIEPRLVRGLDYYVHTVFELTHDALGENNTIAIAGGGRYELTVPDSNKPIRGVGFAAGMERLLMVREARGIKENSVRNPDVFLVSLGEKALAYNTALAARLRRNGVCAALEGEAKSMKSQMRAACRLNAAKTLILGENELENNTCEIKNMADGSQQSVPLDNVEKMFSK